MNHNHKQPYLLSVFRRNKLEPVPLFDIIPTQFNCRLKLPKTINKIRPIYPLHLRFDLNFSIEFAKSQTD